MEHLNENFSLFIVLRNVISFTYEIFCFGYIKDNQVRLNRRESGLSTDYLIINFIADLKVAKFVLVGWVGSKWLLYLASTLVGLI